MKKNITISILFFLLVSCNLLSQSIVNIAGLGQGDGLLANKQSINPTSIFTDSIGNIYFTDYNNGMNFNYYTPYNSIRKIDGSTGIISTVLGGNKPIISSLAGSVTMLWLTHANLYVLHNNQIKIINLNNNNVTTIAGNGLAGNSGDGGLALNACINSLITIAVNNNGDVYINDYVNNYIRKIDISTGIINSFLTQADSPLLQNMRGMCIDTQNNLLITAPFLHTVLQANLTTKSVTRYAGSGFVGNTGNGGLAINAKFDEPSDVKLKYNGDVYILDSGNSNVRVVNASGVISQFLNSSFNTARNMSVDLQGNVYISDSQAFLIYKINNTGSSMNIAGGNRFSSHSGDGGNAIESDLWEPKEIHKNKQGDVYFIDQAMLGTGANYGLCIRKISSTDNTITTVVGSGYSGFSGDGGLAVYARFGGIADFAFDTLGNIYIVDYFNYRIRKVDASSGIISTIAGDGGNMYPGDGALAINTSIGASEKITVDKSGNVYFLSLNTTMNQIRKIDANTGIITTIAGQGGSYNDGVLATNTNMFVKDMEIDINGNLIITDKLNNRIRSINTSNGIITTLAGNGNNIYSGNNVAPLSASFSNIGSLSIDSKNNIFVSEDGKIRKIDSALTTISDYLITTGNNIFYNGIPAYQCNCLTSYEFETINNDLYFSNYLLYKINSNCSANNSPTVSLNSINQCNGNITITATSSDTSFYYWKNSTNYSNSYTTNVNGTYSVIVTNTLGCSVTKTIDIQYTPCVWPGDANSDGVANNLDVLELGLHFLNTGSPRATINNSWQSFPSDNWAGTISNGKNLKHSDCNGDGTINNDDTLAIYYNYGLTHAFKESNVGAVNPQLSILPNESSIIMGDWGSADVFLGDATNPINNINGIAFTIDFDTTIIEQDSIYLQYTNSFIDASNQNLKFRKLNFSNGKLHTATTHTNNINVSGYGKIATIYYKIKYPLSQTYTLEIGLSQAIQSNSSGSINPLTSGSGTVEVVNEFTGTQNLINDNLILVFPNPANNEIFVTSNSSIEKIEIMDITGQIILSEDVNSKSHKLNVENISNGVYFMKAHSYNKHITIKKIVLQK